MAQLILRQREFEFLRKKSTTGLNRYRHLEHDYVILEASNTEIPEYKYYLEGDDGAQIYVCASPNGFTYKAETQAVEVEIEFRRK